MKTCSKCLKIKEYDLFNKKKSKDGLSSYCKSCNSDYLKSWNLKHIDKKKKSRIEWDSLNKEKLRLRKKIYKQINKNKINKQERERKKQDINFKISCNLRTRLLCAIKRNTKVGSAIRDLGCSIEELKTYLESKFLSGMTWDNYGEWHIDHIKPLSSFNLTDLEQFKKACHYSNLQPLWAKDNLSKGAKYNP